LKVEERKVKLQKPDTARGDPYSFGKIFTDHMIQIDYNSKNGWDAPKIVPYGSIPIAITASSLHYGISAYEGITVVKNKQS
jgi:branched-chain amino acid aminotransferase